jgi:hypothetical protein
LARYCSTSGIGPPSSEGFQCIITANENRGFSTGITNPILPSPADCGWLKAIEGDWKLKWWLLVFLMNYSNADGKKASINSENVSKQLNSASWVSVKVQACLCDRA